MNELRKNIPEKLSTVYEGIGRRGEGMGVNVGHVLANCLDGGGGSFGEVVSNTATLINEQGLVTAVWNKETGDFDVQAGKAFNYFALDSEEGLCFAIGAQLFPDRAGQFRTAVLGRSKENRDAVLATYRRVANGNALTDIREGLKEEGGTSVFIEDAFGRNPGQKEDFLVDGLYASVPYWLHRRMSYLRELFMGSNKSRQVVTKVLGEEFVTLSGWVNERERVWKGEMKELPLRMTVDTATAWVKQVIGGSGLEGVEPDDVIDSRRMVVGKNGPQRWEDMVGAVCRTSGLTKGTVVPKLVVIGLVKWLGIGLEKLADGRLEEVGLEPARANLILADVLMTMCDDVLSKSRAKAWTDDDRRDVERLSKSAAAVDRLIKAIEVYTEAEIEDAGDFI